ncbi:hypothetical protein [Coralloluteibacterium stylophorae]|uniref:Dicarboxylate transport domain-containing protein n=1 Tax=Coralloluteibacterium stylophorae TaxID=1776034 RepID=A0A8J8AXU3_9GAMM|nr:hypothetical protein [Coralloluteibacterium stylophorae]MBS7458619.1 hypothetical protein [Coralloluteibacterium stylophorae]
MLRVPILRKLCIVLIGMACAPALVPAVGARVLTATVERIETPLATAEGVDLRLEWPDAADEGQLVLGIGALAAADFGQRFRDLRWRCSLRRVEAGWACAGGVAAGGAAPRSTLALRITDAELRAELADDGSGLTLLQEDGRPEVWTLLAQRVPVAWIDGFLRTLWEDGRYGAGTIDGSVAVDVSGDATAVEADLDIVGFGFDTPDGTVAAEGVDAHLGLDYLAAPQPRLALDGALRGGELLADAFYVALPESPVAVALEGRGRPGGGWRFDRIDWDDGRALDAQASLTLSAGGGIEALDLAADSRHLATAGPRYLDGPLGLVGLSGLVLNGGAHARLAMDARGPTAFSLRLDDVGAGHPEGRFGSDGLDGRVAWSAGAEVRSELRWRGVGIHGIPVLAARLPLVSRDGTIALAEPVPMPALGGVLRLETLSFTPPLRGRDSAGNFAFDLDGLDIAQLAKWLDWPPFTGRLDGHIPGMRYADGRLDFDGGLRFELFDGVVDVRQLSMERPFGVAPTLSADVTIDGLDLPSLTGVFGFGEITGKLDGRIGDLRLVDWTVEAFDAELHTDPAWRGERRISQRAVQDLTSVGGSGIGGGLQGMALGLFQDFGYRRISIRCRLANDVCRMDGLEPQDGGYTIVEGAGLPHLTVVGFRRRVDWPTLVERLQVATEGQAPVID